MLAGVEAGAGADLVVSRANPLLDLSALRSLHRVIAAGFTVEQRVAP